MVPLCMKKGHWQLSPCTEVPWATNVCESKRRGRPRGSGTKIIDTAESSDNQNYKFEDVCGISLDQLQAPPSKQKEILNNMLLHLTEEEFNARDLTSNGFNDLNQTGPTSYLQSDVVPIEADETQGVFGFLDNEQIWKWWPHDKLDLVTPYHPIRLLYAPPPLNALDAVLRCFNKTNFHGSTCPWTTFIKYVL